MKGDMESIESNKNQYRINYYQLVSIDAHRKAIQIHLEKGSLISHGRFFWLDDENDFCSCPANVDGTADEDNWDYVSEWQDLEDVNLDKLFTIHRHLVTDKVTEYEQMRA